ncbi:MAG TPA: alpha-glucuronidase family glycosyl hydrolase, partial [Povalibacter sp.]
MRSGAWLWSGVIARIALWSVAVLMAGSAAAEDGYDLWLRYRPVEPAALEQYRSATTGLAGSAATPTLRAAQSELSRGLTGLLSRDVPLQESVSTDGA